MKPKKKSKSAKKTSKKSEDLIVTDCFPPYTTMGAVRFSDLAIGNAFSYYFDERDKLFVADSLAIKTSIDGDILYENGGTDRFPPDEYVLDLGNVTTIKVSRGKLKIVLKKKKR